MRYLGHVVSCTGITPDPAKVDAVRKYLVPQNIKELRTFLGLANYYRRFVEGYAKIADPLHRLTRKSSLGFQWNTACQDAFDELKRRLNSPPILAYPRFDLEFTVTTDALDVAMGAVLSQTQEGKDRVVAYWSRQLDKAQCSYTQQ